MLTGNNMKEFFLNKMENVLNYLQCDSVELCAEDDELKVLVYKDGKLTTTNLGYSLEVKKG